MKIPISLMTPVFIPTMLTIALAQDASTTASTQGTSNAATRTVTTHTSGTQTASTTSTATTPASVNGNGDGKEFEVKDFKSKGDGGCIKDLSTEPVAAGDFGDYISFGPTVAAKAFNYDLASKRMAFNAGIGAGLSMRVYDKVRFYNDKGKETDGYGIRQIRKRCRAETFDGAWLKPDNKKVVPWFSISPMVFASKSEGADEIQVQPALTVGFLGELVNVGAGFNLSGPDKGHVFLLLSIGYGFKF